MYLPVLLVFVAFLLLLRFLSLRISVELIAKDSGITYTIKGSIFKFIKVMEIKSGTEKKKEWKIDAGEDLFIREKVLGLLGSALKKNKGKIFHIEKLSVKGSFSIKDAAADAILYGTFIMLWQFLLIFLSANFSLEHQNYSFYPDFQNNKNELIFHLIFRVVILKVVLLSVNYLIKTRREN